MMQEDEQLGKHLVEEQMCLDDETTLHQLNVLLKRSEISTSLCMVLHCRLFQGNAYCQLIRNAMRKDWATIRN